MAKTSDMKYVKLQANQFLSHNIECRHKLESQVHCAAFFLNLLIITDDGQNHSIHKDRDSVTLAALIYLYVGSIKYLLCNLYIHKYLQCFDAVGWAAGRASGL